MPINEHKSPVYSENKEETQNEVSSTLFMVLKHLFLKNALCSFSVFGDEAPLMP